MLTHEDKELLAKKGISEEKIAEQRFGKNQPPRARIERRFAFGFSQPSHHNHDTNAKTQPRQQEYWHRLRQWPRQGHVAAYQSHTAGQAKISQRTRKARMCHKDVKKPLCCSATK